jgi:hypothetical protein
MKWKSDAEILTSDFWYDLTDGGYIVPSELLEDENEITEVENAIQVLRNFKSSAEGNGILEYL